MSGSSQPAPLGRASATKESCTTSSAVPDVADEQDREPDQPALVRGVQLPRAPRRRSSRSVSVGHPSGRTVSMSDHGSAHAQPCPPGLHARSPRHARATHGARERRPTACSARSWPVTIPADVVHETDDASPSATSTRRRRRTCWSSRAATYADAAELADRRPGDRGRPGRRRPRQVAERRGPRRGLPAGVQHRRRRRPDRVPRPPARARRPARWPGRPDEPPRRGRWPPSLALALLLAGCGSAPRPDARPPAASRRRPPPRQRPAAAADAGATRSRPSKPKPLRAGREAA